MKHKIKITYYDYLDNSGVTIMVDDHLASLDGEYTYNCLGEILEMLGIDSQIEYEEMREVSHVVTKKMKLVEYKE
jgi:hypothetical protein